MGVEVSPTGSRSVSTTTDRPRGQRRQDRSHAVKRAGTRQGTEFGRSCHPRSVVTMPYLRTSAKFLDSATALPHSLLTGGLLVRVQPEEPIHSESVICKAVSAPAEHPVRPRMVIRNYGCRTRSASASCRHRAGRRCEQLRTIHKAQTGQVTPTSIARTTRLNRLPTSASSRTAPVAFTRQPF
jgi:hypothetical protein